MREHPRLLIVLPSLPGPSETFLRAHIERLPASVTVVHGGTPHLGDESLISSSLLARAWRLARRRLLGRDYQADVTAAYSEAIRRVRPVAVLAEYGEMAAGVLAAGVPLIAHFHGYDASQTDLLRQLEVPYRLLFRDAAAVIAVSQAMRDKLLSLGAPPERTHWNPYGVDAAQFTGADPGASAPVFIAVGRFTPKKAPHLTIKAFAQVHRQHPEARLRMIGFGPLMDPCQALARELGLESAVTFLGACPPELVAKEMRRARCFVQHSVVAPDGDSEGTPVSVMEAGATGLPVVATRHAGIPDVVLDGATGFLVEEGDVDGMARQMLRLACTPALAAEMGAAARQRVSMEFSQSGSLAGLWAIIAACLHVKRVSEPVLG